MCLWRSFSCLIWRAKWLFLHNKGSVVCFLLREWSRVPKYGDPRALLTIWLTSKGVCFCYWPTKMTYCPIDAKRCGVREVWMCSDMLPFHRSQSEAHDAIRPTQQILCICKTRNSWYEMNADLFLKLHCYVFFPKRLFLNLGLDIKKLKSFYIPAKQQYV